MGYYATKCNIPNFENWILLAPAVMTKFYAPNYIYEIHKNRNNVLITGLFMTKFLAKRSWANSMLRIWSSVYVSVLRLYEAAVLSLTM